MNAGGDDHNSVNAAAAVGAGGGIARCLETRASFLGCGKERRWMVAVTKGRGGLDMAVVN